MKKNYLLLALVGLILLVAVLTNPNLDRHKEAIKTKLNSYLQESMKEDIKKTDEKWGKVGQSIGVILGGVFVDRIVDNLVSTDNYVLFSTTKVTYDGQTKIVGVGFFGNVFLSKKLDDGLNQGLVKNQQ